MSSKTLNAEPPAFVTRSREELKTIAQDTLAAVTRGFYTIESDSSRETYTFQDLSAAPNSTTYFAPDALADWETAASPKQSTSTALVLYRATTLEGIRFCLDKAGAADLQSNHTHHLAVLNFASGTSPGGRFLHGARAQEESLARSSNLYSSVSSVAAHSFYTTQSTLNGTKVITEHCGGDNPRFSHAMLLTRNVRFVRDDAGAWVAPADVDVLSSAAVNVNGLRKSLNVHGEDPEAPLPTDVAAEVSTIMRERMARILCAMARAGAEDVILGSFGTGAFGNNVEFVAQTWAELLCGERAPFRDVFRKVVFAIIDRGTWSMFCEVFRRTGASFQEAAGA
ncbi:hypothetical protein B0H14DRAFT_2338300 [Mycena olivaceomarginata]|nr:hypothetical protein B0H14DRAFT_2338300 [Mycena olivaceomarginata]